AQDDLAILRDFLSQGGKVVAPPSVGEMLSGTTGSQSELRFNGLVEQRGNLYVAQRGIAPLFEDQRHEVLSSFWREVLGLGSPQPGYRVVTDHITFHYHIGPEPARVRIALPFEAIGYRYDEQSRPVEMIRGSYPTVTLARREYILLSRVTRQQPWID
ncbi:hypothetical protein ACFLYD_01820, partial [Chloroflexota bacterium]